VAEFVDARDWRQFHNPKNLAMSIAIEAAELMEHFQWLDPDGARQVAESRDDMQKIREELADVLCYVLSLANVLEIDLSSALREKLAQNERKYPAERFRGRFK
jgi:NTP pyrophosphatase (non-canonical NTP hydrolase)